MPSTDSESWHTFVDRIFRLKIYIYSMWIMNLHTPQHQTLTYFSGILLYIKHVTTVRDKAHSPLLCKRLALIINTHSVQRNCCIYLDSLSPSHEPLLLGLAQSYGFRDIIVDTPETRRRPIEV